MKLSVSIISLLIFSIGTAAAQNAEKEKVSAGAEVSEETQSAAPEEETEADPDNSADSLNSKQQLQQTFTLRRTINGEVVETSKKTVTLDSDVPYRPTEAGQTALQQVRAAFDDQVLTRVEAFEEAKLDFTIADSDLDGRMTADEFVSLVESWGETRAREPEFADDETDASGEDSVSVDTADIESSKMDEKAARAKFAFISGASSSISREDYIREYLIDFDTMDKNDDTLLNEDELIEFRAANRGKTAEL